MKIKIAFINNRFIKAFKAECTLNDISEKLIKSGLIDNELSDIDYHENGEYNCYVNNITFTADNGLFNIDIVNTDID